MSLTSLFIVWAVITAALIIVLIYRSTLSMHEDDQLFLDEASSSMRIEQEQLQLRMKRVTPLVRVLSVVSGLLILTIAGIAIWQKINQSPF
jgi:hypothetical protein